MEKLGVIVGSMKRSAKIVEVSVVAVDTEVVNWGKGDGV